MSLIDSLVDHLSGSKPNSAAMAKERLCFVLAHECAGRRGAPAYLPALRQELLGVVLRHVAVDPEQIEMRFDRHDGHDLLKLNIVLPIGVR